MQNKNLHPFLKISERGWHLVTDSWLKLGALTGVGGALAALVYYYAREVEPRWIEYRSIRLKLRGLAPGFEGYRVVQLSDLHLALDRVMTPSRMESIVRHVNRLRPDVILITGDFVSDLTETSLDGISRLRGLHAPDGIFAILGNHDYWSGLSDLVKAVEATGIRLFCNQHVLIRRHGTALAIAGVDDIWEGDYDLKAALHGIPEGLPVILMAHESNYADFAAADGRVTLQLSGHSHGGQLRIPGIGPLALPDLSYRYPMGMYRVKDMILYVNRGLGMAEFPFRLFCRPEVTTFVLTPG